MGKTVQEVRYDENSVQGGMDGKYAVPVKGGALVSEESPVKQIKVEIMTNVED